MGDWCGGDCVWMGPEIDRLKKENLGLRDLVKRLADALENEAERPYMVESLVKEARELKDIDKKDCDAFCPRVATLEEMLNQQTKIKRSATMNEFQEKLLTGVLNELRTIHDSMFMCTKAIVDACGSRNLRFDEVYKHLTERKECIDKWHHEQFTEFEQARKDFENKNKETKNETEGMD